MQAKVGDVYRLLVIKSQYVQGALAKKHMMKDGSGAMAKTRGP